MSSSRVLLISVLAAALALVSLEAQPALAATYVVDTDTDDTLTACDSVAAADCSLRGAITNANAAASPGDVINFDPGVFPTGTPEDIVIGSVTGVALPVLTGGGDTIDGAGAGVIVRSGEVTGAGGTFVCFYLDSNGNNVRNLRLTDCASGVYVNSLRTGNTVGPGLNVYDSNFGISVAGDSNSVVGNRIGTNFDGTAVHPEGGNNSGIEMGGDNNTAGGTTAPNRNLISGNLHGIRFQAGAAGNSIAGNYIGTNAAGTAAIPNFGAGGGHGLRVQSPNNCIGGLIISSVCTPSSGSGNLISGNATNGILVDQSSATGNVIVGNLIGTDAAGNAALGNSNGVLVSNNGSATIGGTTALARNVISGNAGPGVRLQTSGNQVLGNYLGTDVTGSTDLGNGQDGVNVTGGSNNVVGGTAAGAGNVISGNGSDGVELNSTSGNVLQGNRIGTDATGTTGLGNDFRGVLILGVTANSNNNTVGGISAGAGNTIAFSVLGDGVNVGGGTGNAIRGNSIFSNADLGIDLGFSGVLPNDPGDGDLGDNGLQNWPVLTWISSYAGSTVIGFDFNSSASQTFRLDFYRSASCDASGNGEGQNYIGSATVNTGADGNVTGASPTFPLTTGEAITATATDAVGNTSEFSNCVLDSDTDGWSDAGEAIIGTDPLDACPDNTSDDAWPADINNDGFVDIIGDIASLTASFAQSVPPAPPRHDVAPEPPDGFIDVIGDISRLAGLFGQGCA